MSDVIETLGKILPESTREGKRDAIHIPVLTAKAGCMLFAGQIAMYANGLAYSKDNPNTPKNIDVKEIGVVDPFLTEMVHQGKMFWVFLYPGTVTDLTHAWEHPAIPEVGGSEAKVNDRIKEAEEYVKDWAKDEGIDYTRFINDVESCLDKTTGTFYDDYMYLKDLNSSATIEDPKVFWKHMSYLMGVHIKTSITYFSCSC